VRKNTEKDTGSIAWGNQPEETRTLTGQGIGGIKN